jgi:hypothetical protein
MSSLSRIYLILENLKYQNKTYLGGWGVKLISMLVICTIGRRYEIKVADNFLKKGLPSKTYFAIAWNARMLI